MSRKEFEITIENGKLFKMIDQNRSAHVERYAASVLVYKTKIKETLKKLLEDAEGGKKVDSHALYSLAEPVSHENAYSRILGMLALDTSPTITLDEGQYKMYILDEWDWKSNFEAVSSSYGC